MKYINKLLKGRPLNPQFLVKICCKVALVAVMGLITAACQAQAQDSFASPLLLQGDWGTQVVDNTKVVPDTGAPTIANVPPKHTIWFQWSTTTGGEVTFDTFGSVDDTPGSNQLDTVMGVYTGTNLANLNLVAANDDLYQQGQANISYQNSYTFADTLYLGTTNKPPTPAYGSYSEVAPPFAGPSGIRFNAVANTTYFIAVDTKGVPGQVAINWALHPSGVFRFATENSDALGMVYTNGNGIPMLMYQCAETESVPPHNMGGVRPNFTVSGLELTITRVAGWSGRVAVSYATADPTNAVYVGKNVTQEYANLVNGDVCATNGVDYEGGSGTVTFDDFEMSKTITIPILTRNLAMPNRDFLVNLTAVQLDPAESSDVSTPRLDTIYSRALVRILDVNTDPRGTTWLQVTNVPAGSTNLVNIYTTTPTNAVLNFQKANYQVLRWGTNETVSLYINRTGTNNSSVSVNYSVNSSLPASLYALTANENNEFPLQPGSDYATPDPANSTAIKDTIPDFILPGGYTGTVSWGANDFQPKAIPITLYNNHLQQFNEDFQIELYVLDSNGNPQPVGMVNQCSVTIGNAADITSDLPPAGAVDEYYNADWGSDLAVNTTPPNMSHPGTDGEVYGMALQPDGKAVLVGDFYYYDGTSRNSIARATTSGYLDTTFNPGSGANDFISCVALTTNGEMVIGGNFTSYNGVTCNGIALVNTNGALDKTFNKNGSGANGTVRTVVVQADGTILIGGDFTTYNGVARNYLAVLNADGTLDTSFDPGANLNAPVYAVAEQNGSAPIYAGGDFTQVGGISGYNSVARFNADGTLDTTFTNVLAIDEGVHALAVQPDGYVLVGGGFSQVNNQTVNGIARLDMNGNVDASFANGIGVDGPVYSIFVNTNAIYSTTNSNPLIQTNFTIYVGGAFSEYNGTHRLGLTRLNADGSVDTTFMDMAYNQFAGLTREFYDDPIGAVNAFAVQGDGNILIGGTFSQVGGGDFDPNVRPDDNTNSLQATFPYQNYRSGVRNHANFARLVGGATPGPGNIALSYNSFSVGKSAGSYFVEMDRTNGFLGASSANFSVVPGLAQSGTDYQYVDSTPLYISEWNQSRMHGDGLFGDSAVPSDIFNEVFYGNIPGAVTLTLTGNQSYNGDLNATLQLANPAQADLFYLGGENIPLGNALGESSAPLTLIDDQHPSGTFGFSSSQYVTNGSTATINVVRTNGTYGTVTLNYTTVTNGSTAILGSDYRAASGKLTFSGGTLSQNFYVTILQSNNISSVEKYVNLQLYNPQGPVNGIVALGVTNAQLRIINANFAGYLNFSASNYSGTISSGVIPVTVTRTIGSKGTLTVQVTTADGSAHAGTDYTATSTNLTWNNGDVTSRTILVPLLKLGTPGASNQFIVSLSNPELNGVYTSSLTNLIPSATVTLTNDLNLGIFQFASATYIANENGGSVNLTVTRTGSILGTASVHYATLNGTATNGYNYVTNSGTLNFAPGVVAQSFAVTILNDGTNDHLLPAQFYFQAQLSNPSTYSYLGSPTNAVVQIVDASEYNTPSGSADSTFAVQPGMNGPVFALAQQTNGLLLAGGNFTTVDGQSANYFARLNSDGTLDTSFLSGLAGANGPVYSLANQTDDRVLVGGTFTTINGLARTDIARVNPDGSVDTSFNPGAGADGAVYSLAQTFIGTNSDIYAAGSFLNINSINEQYVARLNSNGTVDSTFKTGFGPDGIVYVVVPYSSNSPNAGKVLIGGAFNNVNNFPAAHIARLNVDGSVDTNFNYSLGAGASVRSIVIQSDDGIVLGGDFTNVTDSVNGTITAGHVARIYQNATTGHGQIDTNFVANSAGGANGSVDVLALQADNGIIIGGTFSRASGVTRNDITRLLPSGAVDPTINFGAGLNNTVYAALVQAADQEIVLGGSFTSYNDSIADNIVRLYGGSESGVGSFTFTTNNFVVSEIGVSTAVTIQRTGGTTGNSSVVLTATDVTAISGVNYSNLTPVTVLFPSGEVTESVSIPVIDDGKITPDLTANLALSNPQPNAGLGDQSTAHLTIQNVDSAVVFAAANYSVPKNVPNGLATINLVRLGSTVGTAMVDFWTTTNGTAVPYLDYIPTNVTVTFNPGVSNISVQVGITNNLIVEGNRTVTCILSNAVNTLVSTNYAPTNTTLTIIDTVTAPGQFYFATNSYYVNKGNTYANLTVLRTNGSSGGAVLDFSTVAGTALPGINYTTTTNQISFGDGQTSGNISIQILDNTLAQGTVNFTVNLYPNGNTILGPTNAVVNIVDHNVGVSFQSATNYVMETAGSVNLIIQRVGATNTAFTVNYATTNYTAMPGTNYTSVSNTLAFASGESVKSVSIPILYDTNVTGSLTFGVNLSGASAGTQLIVPTNTTVVVEDANAGLSFTNANTSVLKNAGSVLITVVCSNPSVEPVIVDSNTIPLEVSYSTVDGTATAGVDYTAVRGTLVFTNGNGTNTFVVPIINNSTLEGNRAFSVVLANPTAPGQLVPPSTQTVTIIDVNAGVAFSSPTYTVLKTGVQANINVIRTGYLSNTVTVNYQATNGTAVAGVNYMPVSGTLTFTNGVQSQSFAVPIISSTVFQPDLTVLLQLLGATNAQLSYPSVATLTIEDLSGSSVVPAGAVLVNNPLPTNGIPGIIYPGMTNTLNFAFRDSSGTNVGNLKATLLAANGVSPTNGPETQTYGSLIAGGHSVAQPFTFVATGTNGQAVQATFSLADGTKNIGTNGFTFYLGTWSTSFSNSAPIIIGALQEASPYPSIINVSGLSGVVLKTTVTFTNLDHTRPADIEALVVAPNQQDTLLMNDAGQGNVIQNVTLTFDDNAASNLPPVIVSGTNKPSAYGTIRALP